MLVLVEFIFIWIIVVFFKSTWNFSNSLPTIEPFYQLTIFIFRKIHITTGLLQKTKANLPTWFQTLEHSKFSRHREIWYSTNYIWTAENHPVLFFFKVPWINTKNKCELCETAHKTAQYLKNHRWFMMVYNLNVHIATIEDIKKRLHERKKLFHSD